MKPIESIKPREDQKTQIPFVPRFFSGFDYFDFERFRIVSCFRVGKKTSFAVVRDSEGTNYSVLEIVSEDVSTGSPIVTRENFFYRMNRNNYETLEEANSYLKHLSSFNAFLGSGERLASNKFLKLYLMLNHYDSPSGFTIMFDPPKKKIFINDHNQGSMFFSAWDHPIIQQHKEFILEALEEPQVNFQDLVFHYPLTEADENTNLRIYRAERVRNEPQPRDLYKFKYQYRFARKLVNGEIKPIFPKPKPKWGKR